MEPVRPVFYVSDGTGITAETIGHSLLTQFSGFQFITDRIPFVDDASKAEEAVRRIREAGVDKLGVVALREDTPAVPEKKGKK